MNEKPKREDRSSGSQPSQIAYILIGIGIFWLLANIGVFSWLWQLWPLLLIGIGALLLTGNLKSAPVETHHFTEPLDGATSATVDINLTLGESQVTALTKSDLLFDADLTHIGEVAFEVYGDQARRVALHSSSASAWLAWLNPANWFHWDEHCGWQIGLSPNVPTDLKVQCGAGKVTLDLSELDLSRVELRGGVGEVKAKLPATEGVYEAHLHSGVGEFHADISDGAAVHIHGHGGVGEMVISVPSGAAVRVEARMGVGEINVPSRFVKESGYGEGIAVRGVWQTPDYDSAARKIMIEFDGGVGEFTVR